MARARGERRVSVGMVMILLVQVCLCQYLFRMLDRMAPMQTVYFAAPKRISTISRGTNPRLWYSRNASSFSTMAETATS